MSLTSSNRVLLTFNPLATPIPINNALIWYRSDRGVDLFISNIVGWKDLSGHGADASQLNTTITPSYVSAGGINGLPYLNFAAGAGKSLKAMVGTMNLQTFLAEPFQMFAVVYRTGGSSGFIIDFGTNNHLFCFNGPGNNFELYNGGAGTPSLAVSVAPHLLEGIYNGASSQISIDGGALQAVTSVVAGGFGPTISIGTSPGANEASFQLYEIVVTPVLSTNDRFNMLAYFQARYGV